MPKKKTPKKKKGGRPSSYKPEYCELASRSCMLGSTNEDLAKLFGIALSTVKKWIREKPEFITAIKKGRHIADETVAISLYKRAIGYSHKETKAQYVQSTGEDAGGWKTLDMIKHYPPDTAAAFIWLKNRTPYFRDKPEHGEGIAEPQSVSITIQVEDAAKNQSK